MPVLTFGPGDASPFAARSPKPDSIKAVKLTRENLKATASHVIATLGDDVEVGVEGDRISARESDCFSFTAKVGQWLIEDYNYALNRAGFRTADSDERWKYDLR